MPLKGERKKEYQREYMRARRSGERVSPKADLSHNIKIQTAKDVLTLLEDAINMVLNSDSDPLQKARTIAYVAGVTLKAVEIGQVEERLEELERNIKEGKSKWA